MTNINDIYEYYFVYAQKVCVKSFIGKPWQIVAKNGIVFFSNEAYKGMDTKSAIAKLIG